MVNGFQRVNVIEALLKLTLEPASIQQLDARLAACECIKAFFANHTGIRQHVLRRAIDGHLSGQDEIPNIMSVLLTPPESRGNADPYQTWMASVLMFHLIFEDAEAKSMAMKVTEGDAESGEEVITCVQTIVGHLITGMQRGDDERISVGYLMLLCGWLFEDPDVVNDFLGEGSSIQSLLQETKHRGVSNVLLSGLCTILLGIIYEFSSKDSPISRETLHKLLIEQMGRDPYIDKITRFRESPLVRDFEVLPQTVGATQHDGGLPDIYFDRTFIEFLKDNFSRLLRAIDREPGLEISVITNGVQRGISREMVDSLRAELEDRNQAVQKLESDLLGIKQKLEQEQSELKKAMDSNSMEAARIKQVNEALQNNHEEELRRLEEQHNQAKNELLRQHGDKLRALDSQLKETTADHEKKSQQAKAYYEAEIAELQEIINLLESDLARSKEQQSGESARLQKSIQSLESNFAQAREQQAGEVAHLQKTIQSLESDLAQAREQASEVANLQKTIQSLESELVNVREQHAGEVVDLRATIEKLESDTGRVKEQHLSDLADKDKAIQNLQSDMETLKQQHEKEVADHKASIESLQADLDKAKEKSTQDTQAIHDEYSAKISALEKRAEEAERKAESAEVKAKKQAEEASQKGESADADAKKNVKELEDLRAELDKAKSQIEEAEQKEADAKENAKELEDLRAQLDKANSQIKEAEHASKSARSELDRVKSEVKEKEEARQATQSELEDLLIVFGDLEAKRNQDKVSLSVSFYACCGNLANGHDLETSQGTRAGSV